MLSAIFNNIENSIVKYLLIATEEIKIAVPWFNNPEIFNVLVGRLNSIKIDLLIENDEINKHGGLDYQDYIDKNGNLYFSNSSNRLMHNKYVIIDNKFVITGSYNWTVGAEYNNDENIIITDSPDIIKLYNISFSKLLGSASRVEDYNIESKNATDAIEILKNNDIKEVPIESNSEADLRHDSSKTVDKQAYIPSYQKQISRNRSIIGERGVALFLANKYNSKNDENVHVWFECFGDGSRPEPIDQGLLYVLSIYNFNTGFIMKGWRYYKKLKGVYKYPDPVIQNALGNKDSYDLPINMKLLRQL
jgi:hypothetical protein